MSGITNLVLVLSRLRKASGAVAADTALFSGAAWFDPIKAGIRERIRGFIGGAGAGDDGGAGGMAGMNERRKGRRATGTETREQLTGSFGPVQVSVHRARRSAQDGRTEEWRSAVLPAQLREAVPLRFLSICWMLPCAKVARQPHFNTVSIKQ